MTTELRGRVRNTQTATTIGPLAAARAAQAARRAAGDPVVRLDPAERARLNPRSLRLAVTAKCWDCVGGDADPNPRGRIRECSVTRCALHSTRPYQAKGDAA